MGHILCAISKLSTLFEKKNMFALKELKNGIWILVGRVKTNQNSDNIHYN